MARGLTDEVEDFAEDEGQLLTLLTFLFFGASLAGPALGDISWRIVAYSVLSLTLVRAVPVALSQLGSGLRRETTALLAWFGPRGLASIAFVLMTLGEADLTGAETIRLTVTCTVLLSVVAHGVTARPWARAYGRRMAAASETDDDMPEHQPSPDLPTRTARASRGARHLVTPPDPAVVTRLAAAGCIAPEEEAAALLAPGPDAATLEGWLRRREDGEPMAWLVGTTTFCGRSLRVAPGTYVPRAQTEDLARRAAATCRPTGASHRPLHRHRRGGGPPAGRGAHGHRGRDRRGPHRRGLCPPQRRPGRRRRPGRTAGR